MRVDEHTFMLGGAPVFYRTAIPGEGATPPTPTPPTPTPPTPTPPTPASGPSTIPPVVYLHGAPTSSDDWLAPLERIGGVAPDLLGFGRTAKGAHLEYTPAALADFVEDVLSALGVDRLKLVTHGWGTAAGVLLAAAHPSRVERLLLFNSVPLLEGLRWPWWVRLYRPPGVGELAMGSTTRTILTRWLRRGSASAEAWPAERVANVWQQFDQGTQRAVLRLVRSIDDERTGAMSSALESLQMPTMIIWGERDPWCGPDVLAAYSARLPSAEIERVADAGHWPWLDDEAVIDAMASFLKDAASD